MNGLFTKLDMNLIQLTAWTTNQQNRNQTVTWGQLELIINTIDIIKDILVTQQVEIETLKNSRP